jgi:hypothetical protein
VNNYIMPHALSDIKSLHVTYYGWHDLPQGLWIINEYFKRSLKTVNFYIFWVQQKSRYVARHKMTVINMRHAPTLVRLCIYVLVMKVIQEMENYAKVCEMTNIGIYMFTTWASMLYWIRNHALAIVRWICSYKLELKVTTAYSLQFSCMWPNLWS